MDGVRIPKDGWVVVCDGAKALIFRNAGSAAQISLEPVDVLSQPAPPTRDLGSDRPGRARPPGGSAKSALEEADLHDEAETAFLAGLAERLAKATRDQAVRSMVLVAPPRALGVLRKKVTPAVRALLSAEIAKDFAGLSAAEIQRRLTA